MRTLAALTTLLPLAAQSPRGDARDRVEFVSGEVVRGRVVQRHEPEEVLVEIGGVKRRIPRAQVATLRTVDDALADFLAMRRPGLTVAAEWSLAETAHAMQLAEMARLQAYHVLLLDPDHAGAHELLGHTGSPGKWVWRIDGERVPAHAVERRTLGERFELRSEHFVLRAQGGLRAAVDALFDLERVYTTFWRELGTDLRPRSLFAPIPVHVHGSLADMPKLSTTVAEPYCDPTQRGDGLITTYQEATMERPARLVALAMEELLYRTLLSPRSGRPLTLDQRLAPWIEVGLGRWQESRTAGKPGYAEFGAPSLDTLLASHVLRYRPYGLEDFIHVPFRAFHEDENVASHHAAHATMLVTWLMDEKAEAGEPAVRVRPRFLAYVRACYHEGKGNSSSHLDAALGKEIGRVEKLESPWITWLSRTSGHPIIRQEHVLHPRRSLRDTVIPRFIR